MPVEHYILQIKINPYVARTSAFKRSSGLVSWPKVAFQRSFIASEATILQMITIPNIYEVDVFTHIIKHVPTKNVFIPSNMTGIVPTLMVESDIWNLLLSIADVYATISL